MEKKNVEENFNISIFNILIDFQLFI